MGIYALNANEIEAEKSPHGYTKLLHRSEEPGHPTIQIRHWGPETNIPVHRHVFNERFYGTGKASRNRIALRGFAAFCRRVDGDPIAQAFPHRFLRDVDHWPRRQ